MTFDVETTDAECGACSVVYASGPFDSATPRAFAAMLQQYPLGPGTTIVFDSPGGSLFDALAVGEVIRERRFHTSVFGRSSDQSGGQCASACAYAFLGGVRRTIGPSAQFGLHQFSGTPPRGEAVSAAQSVVSVLSTYVRTMGVSQEVVERASAIRPDQILWLRESEMRSMGVINASGTMFSPAWSARRAQVVGGLLLETQSLQSDGATIDLMLQCRRWDRLVDREPPTYYLHVNLPPPPGGLRAIQDYQLSPTEIRRFTIRSADGETVRAEIVLRYPWRVQAAYGLSFLVNIDARLLEELRTTGFILEWEPSVTGRSRVDVPAAGLEASFAELKAVCEPLWRD